MAIEIARLRVITGGWVGGPGLSQIYFTGPTGPTVTLADANSAAAAVRSYYNTIRNAFSNAWTADVQPLVQVIEATTGALIREIAITPLLQVPGSGGVSFGPTATGAISSWHTGVVVGRKLLRGRTFLTPLTNTAYNSGGSLDATSAAALQVAGQAMIAAAGQRFVVWHRNGPAAGSSDGQYATMSACSVSTKECVLRSRRD